MTEHPTRMPPKCPVCGTYYADVSTALDPGTVFIAACRCAPPKIQLVMTDETTDGETLTEANQRSEIAGQQADSAQQSAWSAQDAVEELRADMSKGFEALGDAVAALAKGPEKDPEKDPDSKEPEKREGPSGAKPAESDKPKKRKVAWRS